MAKWMVIAVVIGLCGVLWADAKSDLDSAKRDYESVKSKYDDQKSSPTSSRAVACVRSTRTS